MGAHATSRANLAALVERLGSGPWPREVVLAAGWSPAQIRRAVAAGRLLRPHRGVLAVPSPGAATRPRTLTRAQALTAALITAPPEAVVSHWSAAEVHGLWTPPRPDPHVHLTVPGQHDDVDHGVRLHGSDLPAELVVRRGSVSVTSIARTAVDVARGQRLPEALIVLDSAARLIGGVTGSASVLRDLVRREAARTRAVATLGTAYDSVWSWPGSVVVRQAIPYVDPGSESPFESSSRGWLILDGIPHPRVGLPIRGESGATYYGDFVWEGERVVGEADGLGKYGGTESEVRASLAAERHRQFDLEEAGWRFVRWDPREKESSWLRRLRHLLAAPR